VRVCKPTAAITPLVTWAADGRLQDCYQPGKDGQETYVYVVLKLFLPSPMTLSGQRRVFLMRVLSVLLEYLQNIFSFNFDFLPNILEEAQIPGFSLLQTPMNIYAIIIIIIINKLSYSCNRPWRPIGLSDG
jgi:hypothetical protein